MAEAMAAVADGGPAAKKKAGRPPSEDQDRRKATFAAWDKSPVCTDGIACVDLKFLEDYFADGFLHCLCGTSISVDGKWSRWTVHLATAKCVVWCACAWWF